MGTGKKVGGIVLIILGTIFLLIGIGIGVLFGAMGNVMESDEFTEQMDQLLIGGIPTEGYIVAIDEENLTADVEYYVEEEECWYETTQPIMNGDYEIGDVVTIYYNCHNDKELEVISPEMFGDAMGEMGGAMGTIGGVFGVGGGLVGLIMLIVGIVLIVTSHKDKKWTEEINARNAQLGIGQYHSGNPQGQVPPYNGGAQMNGQPYNGNPQAGGQPYGGAQQNPWQPSDHNSQGNS